MQKSGLFLPCAGVDLKATRLMAPREKLEGGDRRKGGDLATAATRATEDCEEDLATWGVGLLTACGNSSCRNWR